jgi:hypothetical protein
MIRMGLKLKCIKCNKTKCQRHFRDKNNLICDCCRKWMPTNPFYIPREKKNNTYGLTLEEKMDLHKEHMRSGLSSEESWHRVNNLNFYLRMHKKVYRKRQCYTKQDFLRGLKQDAK